MESHCISLKIWCPYKHSGKAGGSSTWSKCSTPGLCYEAGTGHDFWSQRKQTPHVLHIYRHVVFTMQCMQMFHLVYMSSGIQNTVEWVVSITAAMSTFFYLVFCFPWFYFFLHLLDMSWLQQWSGDIRQLSSWYGLQEAAYLWEVPKSWLQLLQDPWLYCPTAITNSAGERGAWRPHSFLEVSLCKYSGFEVLWLQGQPSNARWFPGQQRQQGQWGERRQRRQ